MNDKTRQQKSKLFQFVILLSLLFYGCIDSSKGVQKLLPSQVVPILQHWNLILGNGTNVGQPIDFEDKDYFYTESDQNGDWIVFKSPNAGNTHGTSNNIRTELAQLKKWDATVGGKMTATLKVQNVSSTGDARIPASYSVVIGQIHSADSLTVSAAAGPVSVTATLRCDTSVTLITNLDESFSALS